MIQVSLEPTELCVDQSNELVVRLSNIGHTRCANVIFKLALPVQLVLLQGADRIDLPYLDAGQSITHTLRVRPKQVGSLFLTSSNFSYRDAQGQSHRVSDFGQTVRVTTKITASAAPAVELSIKVSTIELPLGQWETIEGQITNVGQSYLQKLAVRAVGPFTCDPRMPWRTLNSLQSGQEVPFALPVRVNESGNKVPFHIEIEYTDVLGRTGRIHESTSVRVIQPMPALPIGVAHRSRCPDPDVNLERGLKAMKMRLANADLVLRNEFSTLEFRLLANIANETKFGSDESTRHETASIIHELNKIALDQWQLSFNELCELSDA